MLCLHLSVCAVQFKCQQCYNALHSARCRECVQSSTLRFTISVVEKKNINSDGCITMPMFIRCARSVAIEREFFAQQNEQWKHSLVSNYPNEGITTLLLSVSRFGVDVAFVSILFDVFLVSILYFGRFFFPSFILLFGRYEFASVWAQRNDNNRLGRLRRLFKCIYTPNASCRSLSFWTCSLTSMLSSTAHVCVCVFVWIAGTQGGQDERSYACYTASYRVWMRKETKRKKKEQKHEKNKK